MGEYTKSGIKLGTMDDFRYTRILELQETSILQYDLRDDVLNDPRTLYRFPFPEEDNQPIDSRDMFKTLTVGYVPKLDMSRISHKTITQHLNANGSGYQINQFVPCPFDPDNPLKTSQRGFGVVLGIVGERLDPETGHIRTIFNCAHCNAWISLSSEDIQIVQEYLRENHNHAREYWSEVADRIKPAV